MDDNCIPQLCDPDGLPVGQAIRLAREVSRVEPNLGPSLGAYLYHLADSPEFDRRSMLRGLQLLCAVSDPRSFTATCERVRALSRWHPPEAFVAPQPRITHQFDNR